jgi:energy-coupling factor transporter ATP-binding protein EcfA2
MRMPIRIKVAARPLAARRVRPQAQAQNIDYALHTLGWASFQDLCASVFEIIFDRPVNFYSKTRDGGRDGTFKGLIGEGSKTKDKRDSTLQTKHFSRAAASLTLSNLTAERSKVRSLVKQGRAHSYVIMTNATVTATEARKIEDAFLSDGAIEVTIFGREWINKKIYESPKIRATVPRLYGLGDLSWIVDERAITQALEILGSLGNDMRCYVRTKAHLKAVNALLKHGFVLLIGEPAAGKSTIAANLAMTAIDINGCDVIRVTGPADIVTHWNPREKDRFFWVDDAFGSTQYNRDSADLWNKVLPTMAAALKCGNRFVLTSRDYIWRQARQDLKSESFKPLLEGRVVIYTEDLTSAEKQRILYNHIKFGDQPRERRRWMKPHLEDIANLANFKPEIARRLGNSFFTQDLQWSPEGLEKFVDAPRRFLTDVIRQLDKYAQAAVALIFLNGGRVASPITEDSSVRIIETTLGISCSSIRPAMEHLNNTLFLHIVESGQTYWTYKHPTVADAYAELISEQPELIEIYLRGAKLTSILYEVVYGTRSVKGAKLRVPRKLFSVLALRLAEAEPRPARLFLLTRVDGEFRERYLKQHPNLMRDAITFRNPLIRDPQSPFFVTVDREGLLSEEDKARIVQQLKQEVIDYGDVTFLLNDEYISFLGAAAYAQLLNAAQTELAPQFADLVTEFAKDCDTDDPEGYFEDSTEALNALEMLFPDDEEVRLCIEAATFIIDEKVGEVTDSPAEENDDELLMREQEQYLGARYQTSSPSREDVFAEEAKSVFDDIDNDEDTVVGSN